MAVPFGDQRREVAEIKDALFTAFARVAESGRFILGPEVEAFEQEFAQWLGVPHAVAVASGTEAITLALKALGVGPGDEVITAANTCVPTAAGIAGCGATVRLADCDPDTLMIAPNSLEAAITPATRAIIPVHLYGSGAEMLELRKLADRHNLLIIEDCAQAVGTQIAGRAAGMFGEANAFSFYPTKNLGAYGDGGCVVTADGGTADHLRALRNYGYERRDYSIHLGLNSRLDEIQAAILRAKLPHVSRWNDRRARIADRYREGLAGGALKFPATPEYVQHCNHLFPVLIDRREELRSRLEGAGIQALVHYPTPLHLQPALADLGYGRGDFPNAEWACDHVLSLPIFPQLLDDEVDRVIEALTR